MLAHPGRQVSGSFPHIYFIARPTRNGVYTGTAVLCGTLVTLSEVSKGGGGDRDCLQFTSPQGVREHRGGLAGGKNDTSWWRFFFWSPTRYDGCCFPALIEEKSGVPKFGEGLHDVLALLLKELLTAYT